MPSPYTVLAGDVGGTKAVLCLYEQAADALRVVRRKTVPSGAYRSLETLVQDFLQAGETPLSACLGIAGPVNEGQGLLTNLGWSTSEESIAQVCGTQRVRLLNDLEAAAYGMLHLPAAELVELNPKAAQGRSGHKAVIAAGTGLGEAILYWDGSDHHPMPTEGGHCDFAPQDPRQDALLGWLRERYPEHVSWERVLWGKGLFTLYAFLLEQGVAPQSPQVKAEMETGDPSAVISGHGLAGDDALCVQALDMYVGLYGAEAGNLALKAMPSAGLYISGGIAPKILPAMTDGRFLAAFLAKGRMRYVLEPVPIRLALNPDAPLIGAAHSAAALAADRG